MIFAPHVVTHWLSAGAIVTAGLSIAGIATAILIRRRPSAEALEERRRERLAALGRIVDGNLIDAEPSDAAPRFIVYTYRIAGVQYQCSQDVSKLGGLVQDLRLDYPVQVRYNRANPADSIVVAESWNGLWTNLWSASSVRRAKFETQKF